MRVVCVCRHGLTVPELLNSHQSEAISSGGANTSPPIPIPHSNGGLPNGVAAAAAAVLVANTQAPQAQAPQPLAAAQYPPPLEFSPRPFLFRAQTAAQQAPFGLVAAVSTPQHRPLQNGAGGLNVNAAPFAPGAPYQSQSESTMNLQLLSAVAAGIVSTPALQPPLMFSPVENSTTTTAVGVGVGAQEPPIRQNGLSALASRSPYPNPNPNSAHTQRQTHTQTEERSPSRAGNAQLQQQLQLVLGLPAQPLERRPPTSPVSAKQLQHNAKHLPPPNIYAQQPHAYQPLYFWNNCH